MVDNKRVIVRNKEGNKMVIFLTSSPGGACFEDGKEVLCPLDSKNQFTLELKKVWKENAKCLMISSSPDDAQMNDHIKGLFSQALPMSGFSLSEIEIWDRRNIEEMKEKMLEYDVILLCGGHLPTQNKFFQEIELADSIHDFDGVVIGISAGTMNSAQLVYAIPELEGEALDKNFKRFLLGLGLTDVMVIPHYQYLKDVILDGMNMISEIAYGDSKGRTFYALPDGSYLKIADGKTLLYGEAYVIRDGKLTQVNEDDEVLDISNAQDMEKLILLKYCEQEGK